MKESWQPIPGYVGWYSVSNLGRVRRDRAAQATQAGRILKPSQDRYGYPKVQLRKDGRARYFAVHRLVGRAFLPTCSCQINHKNSDKTDNWAENLEWVSPAENNAHYRRSRAYKGPLRGEDHPNAKLTDAQVREIRVSVGSCREIGERYGIHPVTVSEIRRRIKRRHVA